MVDSGVGQGLTSHCHARNNLPETWVSNIQTQSYASQQWLVVVSNFSNPEFTIRILTNYYAYHMVDSGIGQDLTSHCHAQNNIPET